MPASCRGCNPVDARTAAGRVPIDEDRSAKDAAEQIRLENLLRSSLGKAAAALHQNQFIGQLRGKVQFVGDHYGDEPFRDGEIGRASCRERVWIPV